MQAAVRKNSQGCRIGQDNPGAKLRDSEVDLVLELHQGGMSMRRIAEKFDVSKSCIGHICSGRRRS